MTTLITAHNGEARLIGRCDANCYNATKPSCKCICGGRNHRRGLKAAARATLQASRRTLHSVPHPADFCEVEHVTINPELRNIIRDLSP